MTIGGVDIARGQRTDTELRVARLPTGTWVSLPIAVLRGRSPGPHVWLSAAIHGDELNGTEIIRRVLTGLDARKLSGLLIAAPIVNVFGFLHQDRYLPDRRDLNRCFPGSPRGSLASRIAHLFLREVVDHCGYGIDIHTGSNHRTNLPQVRANLDDPETRRLARSFGAPVMIHARLRDGSLREAAAQSGKRVLVYEAGETLRFDRESIDCGVTGVMRVLATLGVTARGPKGRQTPSRQAFDSKWIRAGRAGILRLKVKPGRAVREGEVVAEVSDIFNEAQTKMRASFDGLVIGVTTNPVVHRGEAIVHLAHVAGLPTSSGD